MALIFDRQLGETSWGGNYGAAATTGPNFVQVGAPATGANPPNFVEVDNNPDQSSPWVTNYADVVKAVAKKVAAPAAKKTTTTAKAAATGKVTIRRKGTAGSMLDRILPLMVDAAGTQTIFGVPPALVYVGAGILSASLLALLLRLLRGGVGRVSNPKRARTARSAQR